MAEAGHSTVESNIDFDGDNDAQIVGPYTVGAGATITEFHAYMSGTSTGALVRPLIYADNAGEPGSLIDCLTEISLPGDDTWSWRDLTSLSVPVSASAVWLGLWFNNSNHRYRYYTPGGNPSRYDNAMAAYSSTGDPPSTWDFNNDTTSGQEWSMYVVYTPAAGGTQLLAPSADSVDGAWTDQAGGTSLAAAIDEATASDTDYIRSPLAPSSSACRVKLASGGDPQSSVDHNVKWRIAKDTAAGGTIGMTVKLYQGGGNSIGGGTLIASFTRSNVSETFTDFTEALSSGEADSITNYGDLYLEFSANQT